jgi:hypothetical protein
MLRRCDEKTIMLLAAIRSKRLALRRNKAKNYVQRRDGIDHCRTFAVMAAFFLSVR